MYARKIAQIADSRRHLRRDSGSLTYRRSRKKARKLAAKRERSFSRRRPLFLMFLFCLTQYFFIQSPMFHFRELEIEGDKRLSGQKIENVLGLSDNTNYWDMSVESMRTNVMNLHQLEDASVSVEFPGLVRVRVAERDPSFYVAFRKNSKKWYSVDSTGVVLEATKPAKGASKILLCHPIKGGTKLRETDLQAVRFFQDQLKGQLAKDVRAINISKKGNLALKVMFGPKPIWVRLGRPEKLQYKLFLLQELMSQLGKDKATIRSVDLRYSAPVVRKRKVKDH